MEIIILIIFAIIISISYFKISHSLSKEKFSSGFLWVCATTFVSAISIFICLILLDRNNELEERVKSKCPEYIEIKAYKLK